MNCSCVQRAAEEITGESSRVGEEKFREARGKLADVSGLESSLNEEKLAADVAGFLFFLLVTWKLFALETKALVLHFPLLCEPDLTR
jgi:hypothetical protein